MARWGVDEVADWLESESLGSLKAQFVRNGVCGADLLDLTHDDLLSMGVATLTLRKRVLRSLARLLCR